MTTEKDPSGANGGAGGDPDNKDDNQKNTVSYETHQKLLAEKKKAQAKADELQAKLKEREDSDAEAARKKLEEEGKFKEALDLEREKSAKLQADRDGILESLQTARKRQEVMRYIQGKVPENVRETLVDVSKVAMNEDGTVNVDTAKAAAQKFEKEYPFAIMKDTTNGGLPNDAAKGGAKNKITYEDWQKLPTSAEMKKRWADVDMSTVK